MDLSKYRLQDGRVVHAKGRDSGKDAEAALAKVAIDNGYPISDIQGFINNIKISLEARPDKKQDWNEVLGQKLKETAERANLIGKFRAVFPSDYNPMTIYKMAEKGESIKLVHTGTPSAADISTLLQEHCNMDLYDLKQELADYISPKRPWEVTKDDVAKSLAPFYEFEANPHLILPAGAEIKAVALSDYEGIALHRIPYEKSSTVKLNPTLEEFLSRVSDKEHFCAIIWLIVNGFKTPYLTYLFGTGGEGKSSFLNMLCQKLGSFVAFTNINQFSNMQMYGKSLVILTENTDIHLLQSKAIKQLTGSSPVLLEKKGEQATMTAVLQGNLIVDSNKMLKLKGEEAEFRRLRLFRVSKPKITELLDANTYTAKLGEDFNNFLNYCRECYEKVGSKSGKLVPLSQNQLNELSSLVDKEFVHKCSRILKKITEQLKLEFNKEGSFSSKTFWSTFFTLDEGKDRYLADNLRDYLLLHKGVSDDGQMIYGLSQKDLGGTYFELND